MEVSTIGLAGAVAAGFVSFLSPFVLPLVPAYVAYVAGESTHRTQPRATHARLLAGIMSAFCVLGFSTVFIALSASATRSVTQGVS